MKTWRPASWSQQAREMCDRQVEYINGGHALIEDAPPISSVVPIEHQSSQVGRRRDLADL